MQLVWTALTNGYVYGYLHGTIYQGKLKKLCVPGLNCYSCPGAFGSCPIGSLQSVLASRDKTFSFYMVGFFLRVGSIFGRFICGWLCPFGLVQDLIYKIPFFRKRKNLPGHKVLKYLKYVILAGFCIILPLFAVNFIGQGDPWFCKWICPSGTLSGGWLLVAKNPMLQQAVGWLFTWKSLILIVLLLLSLWVYRPFCQYLCPLGGIYSFFNPISILKIRIDREKCTDCGSCKEACPLNINVCKIGRASCRERV